MKQYVLDTHAFVWWAVKPSRLGRDARRVLRAVDGGRARAWIPAVVGIELTLLREARRFDLGAAELEAATRRNSEVRVLPLDLAQTLEFAVLSSLHDPFDRMLVAAARVAQCPLVSADERIASSGLVDVVWD